MGRIMEADKVKKTKIICTMGPNADNEETLRALIENGMDVARFNFSHGDYEEQKARMDLLKRVRKEMHRPIIRKAWDISENHSLPFTVLGRRSELWIMATSFPSHLVQ